MMSLERASKLARLRHINKSISRAEDAVLVSQETVSATLLLLPLLWRTESAVCAVSSFDCRALL